MTSDGALKAAAVAWAAYDSCCRLGASDQERAWAFQRALEAEMRLARLASAARAAA